MRPVPRGSSRQGQSGFTRGAIFADLIGRRRPLVQFARGVSFDSTPQDNDDRAVALNLDPSYFCTSPLTSAPARFAALRARVTSLCRNLQGPRPIHHSIVRVAAGAPGFRTFTQSAHRPDRYGRSRRFATMPSSPMAQTCLNTVAPSLPFELQRGRVLTRAQSGVTGREITARTRLKGLRR
jgi:hypothetical protein